MLRRPSTLSLSLAGALLAGGVAAAAEPARTMAPEEVPASLASAVARGDAAIDVFRDLLFKRLNAMLAAGGAPGALSLCPTEAPRIAREVGAARRVELGRTSFRLRNPANAPRPWAASFVAASAGKRPADLEPAVVDLGDRIGLLRPIVSMPACSRCHGAPEAIDPAVKPELARRYPQDRATGFAPGDLRGFFWVEVKKDAP